MKKITLLLFLSIGINAFAQEQTGINFQQDKKWNEILALAKAQQKLIFVDVYTDWCGPCKVMDAEVFPKKNVGKKYNTLFINYKLDAEKGEGPSLSSKYRVKSYPNYLFVNGEGILVYRATSSMSPQDFIAVADHAVDESKQSQTIVELDELYPLHKKDKAFMYKYLSRRTTLRLDNISLIDEYISLLNKEERGELKNLQLILDNGMFLAKNLQLGIALTTLKQHSDKFSQLKQSYQESLEGIENTAVNTTLRKAIAKKDEVLLKKVVAMKKEAKFSYFDNKQTTRLAYYLGVGKKEQYLEEAKSYMKEFMLKIALDTLQNRDLMTYRAQREYLVKKDIKGDLDELSEQYKHTQTIQYTRLINDISKNFSTLFMNQNDLKIALKWSDYVLSISAKDPKYYENVIPFYTETNAILAYQLGDKSSAIAKMEKMLSGFNNKRMNDYFAPLLTKMRTNQKI